MLVRKLLSPHSRVFTSQKGSPKGWILKRTISRQEEPRRLTPEPYFANLLRGTSGQPIKVKASENSKES